MQQPVGRFRTIGTVASPADRLLDGSPELGRTDALLVQRHDDVLLERYASGLDGTSRRRSYSMAKSVLHAAVGLLVDAGRLDLDARAPVAAWDDPADPRHAITLRHLMTMRSGLQWVEEPVGEGLPDSVLLLFGNDRAPWPDTAAWAADRPLEADPGERLRYSSGTSSIVSSIVADVVGRGDAYERWLRTELLDPVGMTSAALRFDEAGTWLASTYCSCTAPDYARLGRLYLDGGTVDGERLLSAEWVATAAAPTGTDHLGRTHTMHWWRLGDDPWGAFFASGYLGQSIIVVPPLELVVVRLGETATEHRHALHDVLVELIATFA